MCAYAEFFFASLKRPKNWKCLLIAHIRVFYMHTYMHTYMFSTRRHAKRLFLFEKALKGENLGKTHKKPSYIRRKIVIGRQISHFLRTKKHKQKNTQTSILKKDLRSIPVHLFKKVFGWFFSRFCCLCLFFLNCLFFIVEALVLAVKHYVPQ